jgi:hypothetical protein
MMRGEHRCWDKTVDSFSCPDAHSITEFALLSFRSMLKILFC